MNDQQIADLVNWLLSVQADNKPRDLSSSSNEGRAVEDWSMKPAIGVIIGFLLLPGSVIVLLASNFGALKGYLIGAISFFGFLFMLTVIWTFGVPGTPAP